MPQPVEVPDFGVIEFPEDMDETQISSAIRTSVYKLPPLPAMPEYDQNVYRDRRFISENNLKSATEEFNDKALAFDKMATDIKDGQATTDEETVSEAVKALKLAETRKQMATRDWEGVQKDPAPFAGSFQSSVAQGALNTAAAVADFGGAFAPPIPEAVEKNRAGIDKLNAELRQLGEDYYKPGPDGVLTSETMQSRMRRLEAIHREREALERPREMTAAGQLAGAAAQTFQNADINPAAPNAGAQIARGAGAVTALAPTFFLGGASLPAAVLQIGGETYERAYTQKEGELRAQGADDAQIHREAENYATVETIKAAPAFAAYMVGGKLASNVVGKMLPEGSRALRGFAGAAAGTGANVATGGIIRKFEGQNFAPTVEQLTQDILFGIAHGVGEARRTPERVAEEVRPEEIKPVETPVESTAPEVTNETPAETVAAPESRPEAPQQPREATDPARNAPETAPEAVPGVESAPEGVARNLGPGAANIEEFGPQKTIAAYNDAVDKQRAERGLEPLMSEARKGSEEIWSQAEKRIEADPNYAADLVTSIKEGKKTSVDDVAQQALLWRMIDLQNRKADAEIRAIDDKTYSPEERAEFASQAAELEGQLQVTEEANRKAGSSSSSALNIRRQIANEDFTLAGMLRRGELAKGDKLAKPEVQKIQAQAEGIQQADKAFAERTAKLEEETAGIEVDSAIKAIEAEASKNPDFTPEIRSLADRIIDRLDRAAASAMQRLRGKFAQLGSAPDPTILADLVIIGSAKVGKGFVKFGKWASEMVREFGEGVKPYLQDAWKQVDTSLDDAITRATPDKAKRAKVKEAVAGTKAEDMGETLKERVKAGESLKDMRGTVQRLAETLVRNGVKGRDALVDRVHEVLKEADPAITRRQTMDLISGYGDFKALNPDAIKAEVRDLKGQMQQVAKIEDILAKKPLQKTGMERRPVSDEERSLIKQVNELAKQHGVTVTDPATQLKTALGAIETRLTNRIKDLKAEIAAGARAVKTKTPAPSNERIEALRKELSALEAEHEAAFGKREMTDEQRMKAAIASAKRAEVAEQSRLERAKRGVFDVPPKTAALRSAELDAIKARTEAAREERIALQKANNPPLSEAQKRLDSALVAKERWEQVLAGEIAPAKKLPREALTQLEEDARSEIAAMRELAAEIRKDAAPKTDPEIAKEKAQVKALETAAAEYERRLNDADFSSKGKTQGPDTAKVAAARALRDAAREAFDAAKDSAKPRRTPEEIAIQSIKANLARRNAELADRLAKGDFSKRPKKPPVDLSKDAEAVRLKAESDRLRNEYMRTREKFLRDRESRAMKAWRSIRDAAQSTRNLEGSVDLSAPRQALAAIRAFPIIGITNLRKLFTAAFSERVAQEIDAQIKLRPNYENGVYEDMGLAITPLNETKFSAAEENLRSSIEDWATLELKGKNPTIRALGAIPKAVGGLVRMSNRAFVSYLNGVRASVADKLLSTQFKDAPPTKEDLVRTGDIVNTITGRGLKNNSRLAGWLLYSPNFLVARAKNLSGFHIWRPGGTPASRKIALKVQMKQLAAWLLIYQTVRLFSDKNENDITKSDFGKMRDKNTRIDYTGGEASLLSAGARIVQGIVNTVRGRKQDRNMESELFRQYRYKAAPLAGTVIDWMTGKNAVGEKTTVAGSLKRLYVPMAWGEVAETAKDVGIPKAVWYQIQNLFGAGVNTYRKEGRK